MFKKLLLLILVSSSVLSSLVYAECTCDKDSSDDGNNKTEALKYKLVALATILVAGAIGVSIPILGRIIPALSPESDVFFFVKAFAAGVILSTGMVHVLPDASESLTSPCLNANLWGSFPFSGFIAMLSAIGTLIVDTFATSYYYRRSNHLMKEANGEEERGGRHAGHVDLHTHTTHGHSHGHAAIEDSLSTDLIRHRVVSQVLELGIIVHSVIIGVSLGASQTPKTIKPLVAALTFHQLFEGMGLGGCISQAKLNIRTVIIMAIFFCLTTPIGIGIGFGISNIYDENSQKALIVEGIFNSASAGILIYMALVDLLAADFMNNSKLQANSNLQMGAYLSLLLGAGCMSLLAKWA